MEPRTRAEAQQEADEIQAFARVLARLEREGVITLSEEQRRKVADCRDQTPATLARGAEDVHTAATRGAHWTQH